MGKPLPTGLPRVTMSGTTPCSSKPQKWDPTRPMPHCTCSHHCAEQGFCDHVKSVPGEQCIGSESCLQDQGPQEHEHLGCIQVASVSASAVQHAHGRPCLQRHHHHTAGCQRWPVLRLARA